MDVNDGRMASRFASEPDDGTPLKMHTDEASAGDLPARERTAANPAGMRPATSLSKERLSRHGPHKHLRVPDGETEVVGKIDKARDRYPYSVRGSCVLVLACLLPAATAVEPANAIRAQARHSACDVVPFIHNGSVLQRVALTLCHRGIVAADRLDAAAADYVDHPIHWAYGHL